MLKNSCFKEYLEGCAFSPFSIFLFLFFAALDDLKNHLENPENMVEMKFLLLEQKFLELISKGNRMQALKVNIF